MIKVERWASGWMKVFQGKLKLTFSEGETLALFLKWGKETNQKRKTTSIKKRNYLLD